MGSARWTYRRPWRCDDRYWVAPWVATLPHPLYHPFISVIVSLPNEALPPFLVYGGKRLSCLRSEKSPINAGRPMFIKEHWILSGLPPDGDARGGKGRLGSGWGPEGRGTAPRVKLCHGKSGRILPKMFYHDVVNVKFMVSLVYAIITYF